MDLSLCLVTYVLLFLIIFIILIKLGKDTISSFLLNYCICILCIHLAF